MSVKRLVSAWFTLLLSIGVAHAGPFGGFSPDDTSYRVGRNQLCIPIALGAQGDNACRKASASEIGEVRYDLGKVQGAGDEYGAKASGGSIIVTNRQSKATHSWSSTQVVSRVVSVHRSSAGGAIAIVYETRFGRRLLEEVVVFKVPKSSASATGTASTASVKHAAAGTLSGIEPKIVERSKKLAKLLSRGHKARQKRQYARALKAYAGAEVEAPGDPAALFGRAAVLAATGKGAEAVALVEKIAASKHGEAPLWLVEARQAKEFDALRSDKGYREALGLDQGGRAQSAFERVAGPGGTWEQPGASCREPTVALKLKRASLKFALTIKDVCQGSVSRTKLAGRWTTRGTDALLLIFPNPGGADETLLCSVSVCSDGSGEDCVACALDPELSFTLRTVRR
jgi:hypothetical protein